MAPNVKEITLAIQQLDLAQHVLPKYQPLTNTFDGEQQEVQPYEIVNIESQSCEEAKAIESALETADKSLEDNWTCQAQSVDNEKAALIAVILRAEEAREATSCDAIVSNVLRNSSEVDCNHGSTVQSVQPVQPASVVDESYWDMPAEVYDVEMVVAGHVNDESHPMSSYWDWQQRKSPEERRQATIAAIIEAEVAREAVSVERMEMSMIHGAVVCDSEVCRSMSVDDEYWTWQNHDCDAFVTENEQREVMIEAILEKEAARASVSLSCLEHGLVKEGQRMSSGIAIVGSDGNEAYWDW